MNEVAPLTIGTLAVVGKEGLAELRLVLTLVEISSRIGILYSKFSVVDSHPEIGTGRKFRYVKYNRASTAFSQFDH